MTKHLAVLILALSGIAGAQTLTGITAYRMFTVQGGDNITDSQLGPQWGEHLMLRPGVSVADGADVIPGRLYLAQAMLCQGRNTPGNLACITGPMASSDCTGSGSAYVGVELPTVTGACLVQIAGVATVNSAQATSGFHAGDVVCIDPNDASKVVDGGQSCQTKQVGVVWLPDVPRWTTTQHTILLKQ